ncbi:MAG TPA: redox-sensing transcriptional repressor Rex [Candidatus Onthovivens sp.]|nr:redox-sensing transcriptional repressor Rex [Candidatus Onthovivens sp.]
MNKPVSLKQLRRLPLYLKFLYELKAEGTERVASPAMAKYFSCSEEQIRKDLQIVSEGEGKPGSGRIVCDLINSIEEYLGYNDTTTCIIVGVGHLGKAFLSYDGFQNHGLKILAGFDTNKAVIGSEINGKKIFDIQKLENLVSRLNIHIAIITTPNDVAQEIATKLVDAGIQGIWNFTTKKLVVPDNVAVEYVNLSSSLAVLSHKIKKNNL